MVWKKKDKKFLDLVIKSHVVVPIWSRREISFQNGKQNAVSLSLYVVKGEKSKSIFATNRLLAD